MRIVATLAALLAMSSPVGAEFTELEVSTIVQLEETVNESLGDMSGSHKHRVRTNALFAGFQLIKDSAETVEFANIKRPPIFVPSNLEQKDNLVFCAEFRTINGYYIAFGESVTEVRDEGGADESALKSVQVSGPKTGLVSSNYSDDLMLTRAFVAPDCVSRRSSYYVPISMVDKPEVLLAVFEIGAAQLKAELRTVNNDGNAAENGDPFVCQPTIRVERGFDCTIKLEAAKESDLHEVHVQIFRPGQQPKTFRARVNLPKKD